MSPESKSKTILNADNTVEFEANDAISVLTATTNDRFLTENGGATAKFTGTLTADEPVYTIVYPYSETNTIESSKVSSQIPIMQKATPKSFASGSAIAVGSLIKETASGLYFCFFELGMLLPQIV